jgi:hypothetical protein
MSVMPTFRERISFDAAQGALMDQSRRYLLIRPEALMGIFRPLPEPERRQALEAFEESVVEQGSDRARAYAAMSGDGEALARTVAETAPQLGWGVWDIHVEADLIRLAVRSSPFAAGFGHGASGRDHDLRAPGNGSRNGVHGLWIGDLPLRSASTGNRPLGMMRSALDPAPVL